MHFSHFCRHQSMRSNVCMFDTWCELPSDHNVFLASVEGANSVISHNDKIRWRRRNSSLMIFSQSYISDVIKSLYPNMPDVRLPLKIHGYLLICQGVLSFMFSICFSWVIVKICHTSYVPVW